MSEYVISVRIESQHTKIKFQLESLIGATEGFRISAPDEISPVDLLIMELGEDLDADFQTVETLTGSGQEVFLTSRDADPDLLRKAMRAGARELFPQPIRQEEVRQALRQLRDKKLRNTDTTPARQGKILHVIGSKGGVGTTTIAVNLATILAEKKKDVSVCLIDMNMTFGEIPLFLDLKPAYTWAEILKNMDRLDSTYLMNVLTRHPSGVHLLASPNSMNGHMAKAAEKMGGMLGLMRKHFDYILIDMGQAINETTLKVFQLADNALLVSILTFPCLANTNRLLQSLNSLGYKGSERAKIVVNRYLKKSEISLADAEKSLSAKIYWTIPNDYRSTISAINQGRPLIESAPKAATTRNLVELAERLYPTEGKAGKKRWGIFGK